MSGESGPAIVGESRAIHDVLDQISSLADINRPVLVVGEQGTGKELHREFLPGFTKDASTRIMAYSWPGNIRELKNVVESA